MVLYGVLEYDKQTYLIGPAVSEKGKYNFPLMFLLDKFEGDIFFGEATFHPEAGFGKFSINEFELIFGNLLDIN